MSLSVALPAKRWRGLLPLGVALIAIVALFLAHPTVGDLQAAIAREEAARSGVGLGYWFGWYGGVSPGSYSLIVPALSTVTGSLLLLCLATAAIALLAFPLSKGAAYPTVLVWAITVAAVLNMLSGRVAFAVGGAIALAAIVAFKKGYRSLTVIGLLVAGLASPLAPAFVGLAVLPFAAGRDDAARRAWWVLGGAALGVGVPFLMFGNPGSQGFPATTLFWVAAIAVGTGLALTVPPARWIVPLASAVAIIMFLVPTGIGSNLSRFFALVLPCLCLYYSPKSLKFLAIALAPALIYATFVATADQVVASDSGESDTSYIPLRSQLMAQSNIENHRVELVDAQTHAGSHKLGMTINLARGWENQSDSRFNPIFYDENALTPESYRLWLSENAVAFVAVSADPLRQMKAEAALVESGLPYLQRVWANDKWELYKVDDPRPIVPAPLTVVESSPAKMVLDVPDTNIHPLQLRHNKYLVARSTIDENLYACIQTTPDDWITVQAPLPGEYVLEGLLSVRGVVGAQPPDCAPS
ncbi:hypothetical protein [Gordonia rubripertincta]|uniref:MFS transporter n=1 Tax=Gordonia rubripertincta TaxID=36822 RepID=A0ABT4MQQ5_GORRU|nr:hypothetical protein [Gordonia rubripertincta]MCZ4549336.1 hypothetical protein [Gordonia rubripertincta]